MYACNKMLFATLRIPGDAFRVAVLIATDDVAICYDMKGIPGMPGHGQSTYHYLSQNSSVGSADIDGALA